MTAAPTAPAPRLAPRFRPPPTRPWRPTAPSPWAPATTEVEIAEEPTAGEGADKTYTVRVTSGSDKEEFTGLSTKKGRNNLATKVNAQSKLIKIEETGAALPEAQRAPATGTFKLSAPSIDPAKVKPHALRGRRRPP